MNAAVGAESGEPINIVLTLRNNLIEFVEAGIVERRNLNLSIQGA